MMIGRRKKPFLEMVRLLRLIEADQDDLASVRALNLLILREVLRAEAKQNEHKAALRQLRRQLRTGRASKGVSRTLKTKLKRTAGFIDRCERQIYIWKCCGDALAFIYLDKFSIKHAFFDTDRFEIKRDAGRLSGKDGLVGEVACLFSALDHNVPAVLCDITNTLRYGDVCLLGASDPCLIEVKSGSHQNARGKRQAAKMQKLRDFLETDRAESFRGAPGETKRSVLTVPERDNVAALNQCIEKAKHNGLAVSRPEPGVTYIVLNGKRPDYKELLGPQIGERQIFFTLNGDKNAFAWAPYTPFILTIRDPEHLYEFIEGDLFIIVFANMDELCKQMAMPGWEILFDPESAYALQCIHSESGGILGISQQMVARVAYEFVSLAWIAESQKPNLNEIRSHMTSRYGPHLPIDMSQISQRFFGRGMPLRSDVEGFFIT